MLVQALTGIRRKACAVFLTLIFSAVLSVAKNEPLIIVWPSENPALRLTFDKFRGDSNYTGQRSYVTEVMVENLTDKPIPRAVFTIYLLDKNKVRIGQSSLIVGDLEARQSAKVQFQFNSIGVPASVALFARSDMLSAKTIPVRIISVPPGASLRVDGKEAGMTPVMVRFSIGTHQLDLTKEGYAPGNTALDVTPDELPGGSITVELGGLSKDTVEMRDGRVLQGDVISVSIAEVVLRIDGKDQAFVRNLVKKVTFVERVVEEQHPVVQPMPSSQPQ